MIIEVKNLIKRYNDFLALDHISFSIREGEIFGLLGPNGAGKSTTISILSGLTGFDGGEVLFLGKKSAEMRWRPNVSWGLSPRILPCLRI